MPQSLSRVLVHLVFSTKNREPFITAEHRDRVFEYLAGTLNAIKCPAVIVGGMPDHVHLLFVQARTLSLSEVVEEVKKQSSKWAKGIIHPDFYWQNGYGAFSVSPSNVPDVTRYIANQEKNHRERDYQMSCGRCSARTGSSGTSATSGIDRSRSPSDCGSWLVPTSQGYGSASALG